MKIAVLGASGFIGRNFIQQLTRLQITPRVITRDKKTHITGSSVVYVPSFTANALKFALQDAEIVVNFIGRFPPPYAAQISTNVDVLSTICKSLDYKHIKQFIHFSAAAAYGACEVPPRETDPLSPDTSYGLSKLLGEEIVRHFHDTHNLPYVLLRPTNVYGADARQGVIYTMVSSAKRQSLVRVTGTGQQIRDFIHVNDATNALLAVIRQKVINDVFNLSSAEVLSVLALGEKIIARVNPLAKFVYVAENKGSIQKLTADNTHLRQKLGWKPVWNLDRGIDQVAQSV